MRYERELNLLRTHIGMVFQHFNLFPHMTALQNVTLGLTRALNVPAKQARERALAELEWRKVRAYEGQVCRRFDRVTVVSIEDRVALEAAAAAQLPVSTIPIAIDTRELTWVPRTEEARHILSLGTMFYPPNADGVAWFASEMNIFAPLITQPESVRRARVRWLAASEPVSGSVSPKQPSHSPEHSFGR